jgi:hypothetical protein
MITRVPDARPLLLSPAAPDSASGGASSGRLDAKRCQRRTGSAFSASGLTRPGSFALTHGSEAVRTYRPGDGGWNKSYCSNCGSHVFTRHPENQELLGLRLRTLDQDPGVRPRAHQFVDYAAPWAPIPDDGLPHFPERMSWE